MMRRGFTIVELLIVIVVIAILASISVVAYTGIQVRAKDSVRKQDLSMVAKSLSMYGVDKGNFIEAGSGCGYNGSGEGWLSHRSSMGGGTNYSRSILDCIKDAGYISSDIIDPSGCSDDVVLAKCARPTTAYMKINCTIGGRKVSYLLARLEGEAQTKPADMNATNCAAHGWWEFYGMNYAIQVNA